MLRISLLIAALVCLPTFVQAGDNWPNFHGPTNDSHSDSTGLPLTWSETENVVWKTPIHDSGWSTPVVWGNQVWLTTATDDGKKSYVLCLDRKDGKVLRDMLLFENPNPEDIRKFNSYASPTPVIEEGRIYVHFGTYGTACLDTRTGEPIWTRRDLPCLHWRGPGSSPFLYENLLILTFDGHDQQYVVALDKRTGDTVWKKIREVDYGTDDGDIKKAYTTPIVIQVNGRPQLISPTSKAALAMDPRTGNEIWRIRYEGFSTAARPLYGDGLLFINSGFPKGAMFAVRPDGKGDVTDTHIVWKELKSMPSKPSSLLIGELLFSVDDTGVASCLEAKTGKNVWSQRVGGAYTASPVYVDGRLYLFDHAGKTTVIAPEPAYRVLATNELERGFRASPAIAGKAFFLRTEGAVYRIERAD